MEDFAFIESDGIGGQVLRNVESRGESPDGSDDFTRAVSLIDSPEVVGAVVQVGQRQALGQVGRPVHHHLGRGDGATANHTIGGGIFTQGPSHGHGHRDVHVAIGRIGIRHGFRQRDGVHVDVQRELIAGGRSGQIILTRGQGHAVDGSGDHSALGTFALEADGSTVAIGSAQGVGLGGHVIAGVIAIGISLGIEARVVGLPTNGGLPGGVSLDADQQVAGTVPSKAFSVEHEFVPTRLRRAVAFKNQSHASGVVRSGGEFIVGDVGHPDLEVLLFVRGSGVGIPAETRDGKRVQTGFGEFVGMEKVFSDGVVVIGVEGEVGGRPRSVLTNHHIERLEATVAAIVVVGAGSGLSVEVRQIDGHLAVGAYNLSVEKYVIGDFHLVNHILTLRGFAGKQVVVVDVFTHSGCEGSVDRGSGLHHVSLDGIVGSGGKVECVGQAVAGPNNELGAVGAGRCIGVVDGELERFGRRDHFRNIRIDNEEILIRGFDRGNGLRCSRVGQLYLEWAHPRTVGTVTHRHRIRSDTDSSFIAWIDLCVCQT